MTDGLSVQNLSVYRAGTLLASLDARIAPGDVLTVMGPSGSGKSTLLAAITGTLAPAFQTKGRVFLNGRDISALPPERRRIGLLFQEPLLFPHLNVGSNLAFGLPAGGSRSERRQRIEAALEDVGLNGFVSRDPATLSGGQAARVALLRALLSEPEALLLDEPFSGLDQALRDRIRELVFTRAAQRGLPVLLVTHDRADADAAGGRVIEISQE
ncbi:MAG: ABC transporter ATP-binding protein [Rhodobacterales bacterium]|nr:MAG: ABC transporter ATP-binding protein [Rhodobacterales bacterium]